MMFTHVAAENPAMRTSSTSGHTIVAILFRSQTQKIVLTGVVRAGTTVGMCMHISNNTGPHLIWQQEIYTCAIVVPTRLSATIRACSLVLTHHVAAWNIALWYPMAAPLIVQFRSRTCMLTYRVAVAKRMPQVANRRLLMRPQQ